MKSVKTLFGWLVVSAALSAPLSAATIADYIDSELKAGGPPRREELNPGSPWTCLVSESWGATYFAADVEGRFATITFEEGKDGSFLARLGRGNRAPVFLSPQKAPRNDGGEEEGERIPPVELALTPGGYLVARHGGRRFLCLRRDPFAELPPDLPERRTGEGEASWSEMARIFESAARPTPAQARVGRTWACVTRGRASKDTEGQGRREFPKNATWVPFSLIRFGKVFVLHSGLQGNRPAQFWADQFRGRSSRPLYEFGVSQLFGGFPEKGDLTMSWGASLLQFQESARTTIRFHKPTGALVLRYEADQQYSIWGRLYEINHLDGYALCEPAKEWARAAREEKR